MDDGRSRRATTVRFGQLQGDLQKSQVSEVVDWFDPDR